ncbi:MAG: SDR family oxidoreductase [Firmicutes bacterium]|nr:SDR family oxidoreductase [Bacillota bacterium]
MDFGLGGKRILVTGAGKGIGAAIALSLVEEGAVPLVHVHRFDAEVDTLRQKIAAKCPEALFIQADLEIQSDVERLAEEAISSGPVYGVVHNAGWANNGRFMESAKEEWQKTVQVDLLAIMTLTQRLLPEMQKAGRGRILHIVGDSARVGERGLSVSTAARGGVLAFGKSLAREIGREQITVNTVALGLIQTPSTQWLTPELEQKAARNYPMGRLGRIEDVVPAILFLLSEGAGWITGQTLSVNGGYSMI